MKFVILGDTHFGIRGDSIDFHNYFRKFYENIFFPFLKENNIDTVVQMGDLFDRRKFVNFNTLQQSREYFFERLKEQNIKSIFLLGNHDVYHKNTLSVNSPDLLLNEYDNITVYNEFTSVDFDGLQIDIVPWICDNNQEEIFQKIKQSSSQVCFGHFEIDGFEMDRGNVFHGGIDRKSLSKYDIVVSGHFHHRSDADDIYYVGTPYELTWADYNDPRGFHIFDTDTRTLTFIQNPYTMFQKVVYDDNKQDKDYWKEFDYGLLKDSFVKLVVVNKNDPVLLDGVMDNIDLAGAFNVTVIDDYTSIVDHNDDIIDEAEDTITILNKYIDNLTLDVESNKLKSLMRELYVEALNIEKSK